MLRTPSTPKGRTRQSSWTAPASLPTSLMRLTLVSRFVLWVPIDAFKGRLVPWSC